MITTYLKQTTDANSFQVKALLPICNLFASEGRAVAGPLAGAF